MRTRLVLLGGQTIALGLMMAFLVVPASALFLDEYGADALPYAYIAVAGAGVLVSSGMSRAQRRLSLAGLAGTVLWAYLVIVLTAWVVLTTGDGLWVTFPLLVLFPLSIPIGFVLVGSQAGRLLDVRQMKAHFPRVVAGFSFGFAVGGLAAAALVGPLGGPGHLLGIDVLAVLTMIGFVTATGRRFPDELRAPPSPAPADNRTSGPSRRALFANPLVVMIFGYQLLSAAVTQLLDFMVWERAAARYPDPSDLAQFQGVFGAIINVASVLFVVVVAGWMLTRYGLGVGLAANPAGVLVLLVITTLVGYAVGPVGFLFFAFVCAQQVTDISLTDGTTRTSINATYQALLPEQRLRAQTMIEGAGVPLALGFVGVLLIIHNALGLDIRVVVLVTVLLTLLWLGFGVRAYREYGVNLRDVLSRRAWDPVALRIDDDASRAVVEQLLASVDLRDVRAGLDALADAGSPDLYSHVITLLHDTDDNRQVLGLEVAGRAGLMTSDALVTSTRLLLQDDDLAVRLAAAAALVGVDGEPGDAGRVVWLTALASDEPATVGAALIASGGSPNRFFMPYLVGQASSPTPPGELVDALVAHADHLDRVVEGLLSDPTVPRRTRERLVHALGESRSPRARDLLVAHIGDGDPAIVEAAARALQAVGHREPAGRVEMREALLSEAARSNRCLRVLALLDDRQAAEVLSVALQDELVASGRRVEVLLSLSHEPRAISRAVSGLSAIVEAERNSALEMLEVSVGRSTAQLVLPMLDPAMGQYERADRLGAFVPVLERTLAEWLRDLVLDADGYWREPWLRACALYVTPELLGSAAGDIASTLENDDDPDVAQTAHWVAGGQRP
jgi:hypothetical protein